MFTKNLLEDDELNGKLIPKSSHEDLFMIVCKAFYCSNDQIGNCDATKNLILKLLKIIILMISNKCKYYYFNLFLLDLKKIKIKK